MMVLATMPNVGKARGECIPSSTEQMVVGTCATTRAEDDAHLVKNGYRLVTCIMGEQVSSHRSLTPWKDTGGMRSSMVETRTQVWECRFESCRMSTDESDYMGEGAQCGAA